MTEVELEQIKKLRDEILEIEQRIKNMFYEEQIKSDNRARFFEPSLPRRSMPYE